MLITITDTPTTLRKALNAAGYVSNVNPDSGLAVAIKNECFTYAAGVYTFVVQAPIYVEGANLKKLDGGTDPVLGTKTFITQGRDVVDPQDPTNQPDPERYITDTEGYTILDQQVHNFVSFDLDRIFLRTCPGETVECKVFVE